MQNYQIFLSVCINFKFCKLVYIASIQFRIAFIFLDSLIQIIIRTIFKIEILSKLLEMLSNSFLRVIPNIAKNRFRLFHETDFHVFIFSQYHCYNYQEKSRRYQKNITFLFQDNTYN